MTTSNRHQKALDRVDVDNEGCEEVEETEGQRWARIMAKSEKGRRVHLFLPNGQPALVRHRVFFCFCFVLLFLDEGSGLMMFTKVVIDVHESLRRCSRKASMLNSDILLNLFNVEKKVNQRKLTQTVDKYAKGILSGGAKEECRGVILGTEGEADSNVLQVVGGATFGEGMYEAIRKEPGNPHCVKLVEEGITNTLILPKDLSEDDLMWVKPEP